MFQRRFFLVGSFRGGGAVSGGGKAVAIEFGAEAEDETDVSADATLRAGDADRGLEEAEAAEPDADLDCAGR